MSDSGKSKVIPYKTLGARLKAMREKRAESVIEVCGAIEINEADLTQFERGHTRPPEDILLLLISHFRLPDTEAGKLWQLAGYPSFGGSTASSASAASNTPGTTPQTVLVLPADARIAYTDVVHVMINDFGVMLNFLQSAGLGGHLLAVARVGMSREHAESLLQLLQKSLQSTEPKTPKTLGPGDQKN